MESLVTMLAFCEAPFDCTSAPSMTTNVPEAVAGDVAASLAAAAKKWPTERLVAATAFCEAPFDGTFDGTSGPARNSSASATNVPLTAGGFGVAALVAAAAKKWPTEGLVATMAFCEAPFDGTSGVAGNGSASATNVPEAGGRDGDATSSRRAVLAATAKQRPRRLWHEMAGTVDGLAIFETVALE